MKIINVDDFDETPKYYKKQAEKALKDLEQFSDELINYDCIIKKVMD